MTGESSPPNPGKQYTTTIYAWTKFPAVPGQNQLQNEIPLGECAQIDQPSGVVLQQGQTESVAFSGYYKLYKSGTFGKTLTINNPKAVDPAPSLVIVVGPAKEKTAVCAALPTPTNFYYASCLLKLDAEKGAVGHRICLGSNYLVATDGKTSYPAGLLEIMLDSNLLEKDMIGSYDYRWSPVFAGGCRDIYTTSQPYFMVGPPNTGDYWDPSKIAAINYTEAVISK